MYLSLQTRKNDLDAKMAYQVVSGKVVPLVLVILPANPLSSVHDEGD